MALHPALALYSTHILRIADDNVAFDIKITRVKTLISGAIELIELDAPGFSPAAPPFSMGPPGSLVINVGGPTQHQEQNILRPLSVDWASIEREVDNDDDIPPENKAEVKSLLQQVREGVRDGAALLTVVTNLGRLGVTPERAEALVRAVLGVFQ